MSIYTNIGDMFATMIDKTDYRQNKFKVNTIKKIAISYSTNSKLTQLDQRRKINDNVFINFSLDKNIENIKNYQQSSSYLETYKRIKEENPDLVITVDSSFAHFAAKINIPILVLLKKDFKEWRWVFEDKNNISMFLPSVKTTNNIEEIKSLLNN